MTAKPPMTTEGLAEALTKLRQAYKDDQLPSNTKIGHVRAKRLYMLRTHGVPVQLAWALMLELDRLTETPPFLTPLRPTLHPRGSETTG